MIVKGEYKDSPVVTIKNDEADRWPFTFGPAKAAKILDAIAEDGIQNFLEILMDVSGDKLDPTTKEKIEEIIRS